MVQVRPGPLKTTDYRGTGTYSHPAGTTEQDMLEITISQKTVIHFVKFDLNALTKNTMFRVYMKVGAGGTYRRVEGGEYLWTVSDNDILTFDEIYALHDVKFTIQSELTEGTSRNIPYEYWYELLE